ncbi:hypothetical protein ACWCQS_32735 [Streptomyces sp. NPDC002076]
MAADRGAETTRRPEIVVDTNGLHELAQPRRSGWWPAGALISIRAFL